MDSVQNIVNVLYTFYSTIFISPKTAIGLEVS